MEPDTLELIEKFNPSYNSYFEASNIVEMFEEQVLKFPNTIALEFEDKFLTYSELDKKSNQLAFFLRKIGIGQGRKVAICLDKKLEIVVGILGIMKAGAAYVPIDANYPAERIKYVLDDSSAELVLSDSETISTNPFPADVKTIDLEKDWNQIEKEPTDSLDNKPSLKDLAYIIYTSGSTGRPKGVLIDHLALVSSTLARISYYQGSIDDALLVSSIGFDASVGVIFPNLVLGKKVVLCRNADVLNPFKIKGLISRFKDLDCSPSYYKFLLEEKIIENSCLTRVILGGESLDEKLVQYHFKTNPNTRLFNEYGPTEGTVSATITEILSNTEKVTIGKPINNTKAYIIDDHGSLVPIGVPGELCITGSGISRGYLNSPDLTEEKFIKDPFDPSNPSKVYRTGDLAKWLPDGNIEYLGRLDDQVKIRGFRIELGEVQSSVNKLEGVDESVVLCKQDQSGNKFLVAYVIADKLFLSNPPNIREERWKEALMKSLPEYMVPSYWVHMDKFPLSHSGKIDKKTLPDPEVTRKDSGDFIPPNTENEKSLAAIWSNILGISKIGINDNFFALGGHSLAAMRLISMVKKELGQELQINDVFSFPTIKQLSLKLDGTNSFDTFDIPEIIPLEEAPLSFNQESLWLIDKLNGSLHYHIPLVLEISGNIKQDILERAFQVLIDRHTILKTIIAEKEGVPFQKTIDSAQWNLEIIGLEETASLDTEISKLIYRPFDLSKDYTLRATLINFSEEKNILILVFHHIAFDGWSLSIFKKELSEIYNQLDLGHEPLIEPTKIQYSQYSIWQKRLFTSENFDKEVQFWIDNLNGLEPLQLPTDFERKPSRTTAGKTINFQIGASQTDKLSKLSQENGATLYMTLLAAFKILLKKYSGQDDICIGTPVAGRDLPELEELIGYFINSVPIHTSIDSELTFLEFLNRVKTNTVNAFSHRKIPFEKIVEATVHERDAGQNPIFQVMFVLQNTPEADLVFPGFEVSEIPYLHQRSALDLTFEITQKQDFLEGRIEFSTDLFTAETIERMASHYQHILKEVLSNPDLTINKTKLLSHEAENQLIEKLNPSFRPDFPENTIADLFQKQVEKSPEAIALEFEGKSLSYFELDRKSNQLARFLKELDIKKEDKIPICLDRCFEMIIGILGILKAGAAYVPIDPSNPNERIKYVLDDLDASLVLTNSESKNSVIFPTKIKVIDLKSDWHQIETRPTEPIKETPLPEDLAYVIYTSGTTGKPKGVLIEHVGLTSFLLTRMNYHQKVSSSLLIPSFAFDASVSVIFGILVSGGKLILSKTDDVKNPYKVKDLINESEELLCVPSYYRFLLDEGFLEDTILKRVVLAGENLDQKLVSHHFTANPHVRLFNEYGPTEGTVWATVAEIFSDTQKVTIGKPIENTRVYILDKHGSLQDIGISGELCIAGSGISRGYLNQSELTAEKFELYPFFPSKTQRMYHTGDLARWLPDGNIDYLGRIDNQVKIRGYRVELGEIEARLNQLDEIKESVVILRKDEPENQILVAYIVFESEKRNSKSSDLIGNIKIKIKEILPDYMIPNEWVILDKLPLTSNNKIDRKNLPKPKREKDHRLSLNTANEKLIAQIWSKCLKKEFLNPYSDFFESGGHSLLAVKSMALLEEETGIKYPLNAIFKHSKLSDFAKFMDEFIPSKSDWSALVPIKTSGSKPPIYLVHGVGTTSLIFYNLAKYLDEDQPVYAFQPVGLNGIDKPHSSVEEMANHYLSLLLESNPDKPFILGGYSFGMHVALEMARQLFEIGKTNFKFLNFDTPAFKNPGKFSKKEKIILSIKNKVVKNISILLFEPKIFLNQKIRLLHKIFRLPSKKVTIPNPKNKPNALLFITANNYKVLSKYQTTSLPIKMYLLRAKFRNFYVQDTKHYGWDNFVEEIIPIDVSGYHDNFLLEDKHLIIMAQKIKEALEE